MPQLNYRMRGALLLCATLGACGGERPLSNVSQRDSAGITIVENHAATWTDENAWSLSTEPVLSIGTLEGAEEYQLYRVTAALRLPGGGLFIANGGTNEIRFYDDSGQHVRTVGREGSGPGEFKVLGDVWRFGSDSVLVVDQNARRFTVLSIDGAFGRTANLPSPPEGFGPVPKGVFDDASVLMWARLSSLGDKDGQYVDSVEFLRYSLAGDLLNRMVRRPRITHVVRRIGDGGIVMIPPYSPRPSAVVQHDRWYYGEGANYEIERYSPTGRLTHLYRRSIPNRPVTQEMIDEYREGDADGNDEPQLREMRMSIDVPATMPAFQALRTSTDGTLWVQRYTREDEQPLWSAFREDGGYLGDLDIPVGARVLDIGDDYLVLLETDELEIEYVRVYELHKNR